MIGRQLLAALCSDKHGAKTLIEMKLSASMFMESDKAAFKFVQKNLAKYGKLPSPATMKEQGFDLPTVSEPTSFYLDKLTEQFRARTLQKMGIEVATMLKKGEIKEANDFVKAYVANVQRWEMRTDAYSTSDGMGNFETQVKQKMMGVFPAIKTGWKSFDEQNLGFIQNDFISVVGRTGGGKSWLIMHLAYMAWKQGKTALVVSMEMPTDECRNRLLAIASNVPYDLIHRGSLSDNQLKQIKLASEKLGKGPGKIIVVDGVLNATIDEVSHLTAGYNPDILFVDGAYMLKSGVAGAKGWEVTVDTVYGMKFLAGLRKIPVVASYQFNTKEMKKHGAGKKDKATKAVETVDDIAHSQEISRVSTLVIGVSGFEESDGEERRLLRVLKNRPGQKSQHYINWNFDFPKDGGKVPAMSFDEPPPTEAWEV